MNWSSVYCITSVSPLSFHKSLTLLYLSFLTGLGIGSLICSFPQIKWAIVSDLLRSLKTNERLWANHSGRSRQMINHEQISQVAHDKWANMSDSLRSLRRNVRSWANRSGCSVKMSKWTNRSLFEQIAHSLTFLAKKERFPPKFDERIPNPAVKKAYVRQRVDMETNAFKVWQITVFKNSVLL